MALSAGTRLGPYEIVGSIGAGGMGEVYEATDTRLGRTVAIKILPSQLSDHEDMKARFEREAQTIAGLSHPNICTLHDVGEDSVPDDETGASATSVSYLVLEHLAGETVADRIARGPIPLVEALPMAIAIADALDKAHKEGIVHRDLKPANVMLTDAGPKLLDFGPDFLVQSRQKLLTARGGLRILLLRHRRPPRRQTQSAGHAERGHR